MAVRVITSPWGVATTRLTLVVLCVLIGTGCTRTESSDRTPQADAASPTPSQSVGALAQVPELSPAPHGERVAVRRLPQGEPPKVEYLDGTTMLFPNGRSVALRNEEAPPEYAHEAPGRFYFGFARFGNQWLTSSDSMGSILQLFRLDGSLRDGYLGDGDVVGSSPDSRRVLGTHLVVEPDGTTKRFRGWGIGFFGRDIVVTRGYRVYVGDPRRGFTKIPGLLAARATASAPGLVIGESRNDGPGVFDLPGGNPVLLAPGASSSSHGPGTVTLNGISPDGAHLVATQHVPTPETLVVASVTSGAVVASVHGAEIQAPPYWEDPLHFLVVVNGYILRIAVDGTLERAAGPSRDGFVLPAPRQ